MDEPTSEMRNKEVSEMLDYAYATYRLDSIIRKGEVLANEYVDASKEGYAKIVAKEDVAILNKKIDANKNYSYNVITNKLKAPLKIGDVVGRIDVLENGNIIKSVDLTVNKDISKANIIKLYLRFLKNLLTI